MFYFLDEQCSDDMVVISCIIEFLEQHEGDLIKELKVCNLNFNVPEVYIYFKVFVYFLKTP